jgi:hypothetical protein
MLWVIIEVLASGQREMLLDTACGNGRIITGITRGYKFCKEKSGLARSFC